MIETDQELANLCCRGDRRAFDEIVRRTGRWIYARLCLETGDSELAEDLTQETYLLAWRSIGTLARGDSIRGWLAAIANRVAIDAARRRRRIKRGGPTRPPPVAIDETGAAGTPDKGLGPPERAERREQAANVLRAMRQLPEEYRQVLAMRYLAGADYAAIARQLAISDGSLRGLLARGLAMLREIVEADELAPADSNQERPQ